jgi:DNA polymerase-3 subunit gamma/tau
MSTTLYRKYRPQTWADVAGQNHVKVTLSFEVQTGRLAHAYLFSGPRGVGKTTVARILARAVNCDTVRDARGGEAATGDPCGECASCRAVLGGETLDIIEIDAASNRGIDAVRENIVESARFAPSRLDHKVFIIDEVHMLTNEAWGALLKTLEEPPAHVMFVLATTELHKVPATIASRCQRFDFRKIPFDEVSARLRRLAEREGIVVDKTTIEDIARAAEGCLRDGESLLGKVLTLGDGHEVSREAATAVLPRSDWGLVSAYVEALLREDARTALTAVDDCLEAGLDVGEFADDVVTALRETLLTKITGSPDLVAANADEGRKTALAAWAGLVPTARLVHLLEMLMERRKEMRLAHPAQLPLEIAAVRAAEGLVDEPVAAVPRHERTRGGSTPISASPNVVASPRPPVRRDRQDEPTPANRAEPAAAAAPVTTEGTPVHKAPQEHSVAEAKEPEAPVCSVEQVSAAWPAFVRLAGTKHFSLTYLLSVAKPLTVKGKVVNVGFEHSFNRDKFNQPKNRRLLEEALTSVMGFPACLEGCLSDKCVNSTASEDAESSGAPAETVLPAGAAGELAAAFGGTIIE